MSSNTAAMPTSHYLNNGTTLKSWVLTRDHKRIALMYIAAITFFFGIGGFFAGLIRLELLTPAGDLLSDETYNKVFTMHGVMMVFFVLIPLVPASLGNFLLPLMLGTKDVAFPKLNLLSFYVYALGSILTLWAIVSGGLDTGWTFYTPFSTVSSTSAVVPAALGIFVNGFSSILTGLNFMVTIHRMRAPGLTWFPSGSTGLPRPVSRTRAAVAACVEQRLSTLPLPEGRGVVSGDSLAHGQGFIEFLLACRTGGPFAQLDPLNIRATLDAVARPEFAIWFTTPPP